MHPLHTPEVVIEYTRNTGEYFDPERVTGRTTALALMFLSQAIKQPERPVKVQDHHDTLPASRELLYRMRTLAYAMQLQHLVFNEPALTVTFTRGDKRGMPQMPSPSVPTAYFSRD